MDLGEFEAVDWDEENDPEGNLAHCLRHGLHEGIVGEVLSGSPVEIRMRLQTAEFAVVGPDAGGQLWTLLFDRSYKRGDWLRPITGWTSKPAEKAEWQRTRGERE